MESLFTTQNYDQVTQFIRSPESFFSDPIALAIKSGNPEMVRHVLSLIPEKINITHVFAAIRSSLPIFTMVDKAYRNAVKDQARLKNVTYPELIIDQLYINKRKDLLTYLKKEGFVSKAELATTRYNEGCERDESGKVVDPITASEIPDENVVSIREGNKTYCFDVATLYQDFKKNGKLRNPYTQSELGPEVVKRIQQYQKTIQKLFAFTLPQISANPAASLEEVQEVEIDGTDDLVDLILAINEGIGIPAYRGRQNLFTFDILVTVGGKQKSIYDLAIESKIDDLNFP